MLFDADSTDEARDTAAKQLAAAGARAVPALTSSLASPEAVGWAAEVLADIGPAASDAVPELLRLLRERQCIDVVRHALISIGGTAVERGTVALLTEHDPELRRDAAYVASRLAKVDPQTRDALLRLRSDESAEVRAEVMKVAVEFGPTTTEGRAMLVAGCNDHEALVRDAAFAAIGQVSATDADVAATLPVLLRSDDPDVRERAAGVLADLGSNAASLGPALIEAASGADADVLASVARALVAFGEQSAKAALTSTNPDLVRAVIREIASAKTAEAWRRDVLTRVLADTTSPVARDAVEAIARASDLLEDKAIRAGFEDTVRRMLTQADASSRLQAARVAGADARLPSDDFIRAIASQLLDPDPEVRQAVIDAVRQIGPAANGAAVSALNRMWTDGSHPESERIRAAGALGALDPKRTDVLAWLADRLSSERSESWEPALGELQTIGTVEASRALASGIGRATVAAQRAGVSALGRFQEIDAPAWQAIERTLASSDARARRAAAIAAARPGARPASVADALRRLVNDPDPDVRHAVEDALRDRVK